MDFSRNWLFVSEIEQQKIADIKILLVGCGLGSYIATSLARFGVKNFIIADGDTVSESNLNRQYYNSSDINRLKSESLKQELELINPDINIEAHHKFLEEEDLKILIPQVDVIINAIDFDSPLFLICNKLVKENNKIEIFSVNLGFGGCTIVFSKESPSLEDFFNNSNPQEIKMILLDWMTNNYSSDYFKEKFREYKTTKSNIEPQMVTGCLANSLIAIQIIIDILSNNVKYFPKAYSIYTK